MNSQKFQSVWDAIENTPQAAASMKARSTLLMEISKVIVQQGLTQQDAASLFGVTQPRISDLMRGKIHLFSLDMLMGMAATAGMSPVVKISKPKTLRAPTARRIRKVVPA
jgi:predicted XRE-type DNA-binding protein